MDARDRLRRYLEQRRDLGETELVLDALSVDDVLQLVGARQSAPKIEPERVVSLPASERPIERPSEISLLPSIEAVAEHVAHCERCSLYQTAQHPVPGEGNQHAELVCVGEAPGANEDAAGRPFVGEAGQLLTKILAAIQLRREDVFICNVLKHRPPGNRDPRPEEVSACRPYLERQLALIRPHVILALGRFAAQTLLETTEPLSVLRGKIHKYHGIPVVVTYHPAALLRNESWKRPTWEDVKLARRILDTAREARQSAPE